MTKLERAERAVIDAVMGKEWELLAIWLDIRFKPQNALCIQRDLRKIDAACKRLAKARKEKR